VDQAYTTRTSSEGIESTSQTQQTFTVFGLEPVEAGAGGFEALRIDGASTVSIVVPGTAGFNLDGTSTHWLVWGVGFVRATNTSSGSSSTSILVSYSVP
jgi:hypothetical protein